MRLCHLIEKQEELFQFPLTSHQLFEASQFVIGSHEDIAAEMIIVEAIDKFQYVLAVEKSHVFCLFFNAVEVESIDHDRFYRVYLTIFNAFAFLHLAETSPSYQLPCDELFVLETSGNFTCRKVAIGHVQVAGVHHLK